MRISMWVSCHHTDSTASAATSTASAASAASSLRMGATNSMATSTVTRGAGARNKFHHFHLIFNHIHGTLHGELFDHLCLAESALFCISFLLHQTRSIGNNEINLLAATFR